MARMIETTIKLPLEAFRKGKQKAREQSRGSLSAYVRELVLADLGLADGNGKKPARSK